MPIIFAEYTPGASVGQGEGHRDQITMSWLKYHRWIFLIRGYYGMMFSIIARYTILKAVEDNARR